MTLQVPMSVVGYDVLNFLFSRFSCFGFHFRMEWWMALYRQGPPIWWTIIGPTAPTSLFSWT